MFCEPGLGFVPVTRASHFMAPNKGCSLLVYKVITGNSWKSPICKVNPKTGPDVKKKTGILLKPPQTADPRFRTL